MCFNFTEFVVACPKFAPHATLVKIQNNTGRGLTVCLNLFRLSTNSQATDKYKPECDLFKWEYLNTPKPTAYWLRYDLTRATARVTPILLVLMFLRLVCCPSGK
ncbi:MAG: hypothetical protein LBJ00_17835 [Planctomycetaceae bacterium]|nr:hypothetical protein [Planctomycetaceae bacterium]